MITFDPDKLIAETLLWLINEDVKHMDGGGLDPMILTQVAGKEASGYYMPLNWVDKYAQGFEDAWTKFMNGQTYCEYGFYLRDVTRFLRSKVKKK